MRLWRRYSAHRNRSYHETLGLCQREGRRLGTLTQFDGIWVVYQLNSQQWRFRHGKMTGPFDGALFIDWTHGVSDRIRAIYRDVIRSERAA